MRTRPLCLLFLAALAAVCLMLYFFPDQSPDPYRAWDGEFVRIQGSVIRKERRQSNTGEESILLFLSPDTRSVELVEVRLTGDAADGEPLTGQIAEVSGRVSCFLEATNPGVFDSRGYYAVRGVVCRMYDARVLAISGEGNAFRESLYRLRRVFAARLEASFSAEDAALLKAMLLGDSSALDAETKRMYRMSGILHLLCVSGIHCALVGGALLSFMKRLRLPRPISAVLCCFIVYSYALMCGMAVSALRAVCMFSLKLLAERLKRSYDMVSAMSLIGLLLLAEEPRYAQDSGFLMSFCTIAALGLMLPALFPQAGELRGNTGRSLLFEKISEGARAGVSILLFTLPVQMCCYYVVPLSGLLLNILFVPMMAVLMPAGMGVMLLAGVVPPLSGLVSFVPHLLLRLISLLSGTLASLPYLTWYAGAPAAWQVILYYALLGVFLLRTPAAGAERKAAAGGERMHADAAEGESADGTHLTHGKRRRPGMSGGVNRDSQLRRHHVLKWCKNRLCTGYVLLPVALVLLSVRTVPALQMTMLDVGQGDAIVVRQGDVNLLIDGGSTSASGVGTYRLLPFLQREGIRHLDAVFVSHEDEDHISGIIELMEDTAAGGVSIGHLYLPDIGRESAGVGDRYEDLLLLAREHGIPVSFLHTGLKLQAGDLILRCLGPSADGAAASAESANEHSMILHLQYGSFSALLTGDVEGEGLTELNGVLASLPAAMRTVDVLKVAHHGSRFTTDATFLSLIDARVALISCGSRNRYGHPHEELLERLAADGCRIFTTPECGAITVTVHDSPSGGMYVAPFLSAVRQD